MDKNLFSEENLPILMALQKSLPNNIEFGRTVRKSFRDFPFVSALPNDQDLGRQVRSILMERKKIS